MKLFLTSDGICTEKLTNEFLKLIEKPSKDLSLAFIPTAANIEDEDKGWLIDNLAQFKAMGFAKLDIIDFSALPIEQWLPRFEAVDILVFGGGDTKYLMATIQEAGFDAHLKLWVETKILVGISAGSVMCGAVVNPKGQQGMNLIDFLVVPHKGASFRDRTSEMIRDYADSMQKTTYWLDDSSAVVVNGNYIEVVGSGKHEVFEV